MKRQKVDSQTERMLLIGMVMSKEFLSQAAGVLDLDLIEASHFRQVASWCFNYFKEYKQAPKVHIENIFHAWVERGGEDNEQIKPIHDLLSSLSTQYDSEGDLNVPYLLDSLGKYISQKRLTRLRDNLEYSLSEGDIDSASQAISSYSTPKLGVGSGLDLLNDKAAWERAFIDATTPLIEMPGDAGRFFNPALTRDALIGIQSPEKRGKTWWCVEFTMRALRQRRKVALFEVGDLSESQILLRLGVRLTGRPLRKDLCGKIKIPKRIKIKGEDREKYAVVKYVVRNIPRPVTKNMCIRSSKRFLKACRIPSKIPHLMVSVHSTDTINVRGITGILDLWKVEKDFTPDVIIIDYADILAPENPREQSRDRVNDTWKALRRLSQERHALVISPTQATRGSYDSKFQTMAHASEDKRKLAHVTGMFGLNQEEEEKNRSVMRLNWVVLRESPFQSYRPLYVGSCFSLGKAMCCASL